MRPHPITQLILGELMYGGYCIVCVSLGFGIWDLGDGLRAVTKTASN